MMEEQGIMPRLKNDVTPSAGTGGTLRQTREAQGLTVDDVCRRLRYSRDTVLTLENERFDKLPEPIFAIGYIKGYSRFLGLDPAPMISQYRTKTGVVAEDVIAPESPQRIPGDITEKLPFWGAGVAVVLVVTWLLWAGFVGKAPESPTGATSNASGAMDGTGSPVAEADGLEASVPVEASADFAATPADERQTERAEIALFEHPPSDTTGDASRPESTGHPATVVFGPTAEGQGTAATATGRDVLAITYNAGSWTEVYDADNKRLLFDLVKSGDLRRVEGRAPFRVRLGKSDAVNIEINGTPFDHARFARPDRTALFTVAVNAD